MIKYKYGVNTLAEVLQAHNNIDDYSFAFINHKSYALLKLKLFKEFMSDDIPLHIVSDSDCDGLSALAVVLLYLDSLNITYSFDTLQRSDRNPEAHLKAGCKNLLLDCGSGVEPSSFEQYKILVIDHHEPQYDYSALPVINPHVQKQDDRLCGASLTFLYFSAAYKLPEIQRLAVQYAAIGTIADMVPLVNDNRHIVIEGLRELNENPALSLQPLLDGLKLKEITEISVGFYIAPTINAASRFGETVRAYNGYIKGSVYDVKKLLQLNKRRKDDTSESINSADITVFDKCVVALTQDSSVTGLVATRLSMSHKKPTIAINKSGDNVNFSIRSLNSINVVSFMTANNISGGGHPAAGGGTVLYKDYAWLCDTFVSYCNDNAQSVIEEDYIGITACKIDSAFKDMQELRPFGMGYQLPLFVGTFVLRYKYSMGIHYNMKVSYGDCEIEALYFYPETDIHNNQKFQATFEITGNNKIIIRKVIK